MKCENKTALLLLHVLNFFDGLLTLYAVSLGVIEVNPVMRLALSAGPFGFLAVKVGIVLICLHFLDKQLKGSKRKIFTVLLVIYTAVIAWHVFGVFTVYSLPQEATPQAVCAVMGKGYEF